MNLSYNEKEALCIRLFSSNPPYWHLWTGENSEIVFQDEDSFRIGMNCVAFSAARHPEVKVITFELMSNHVHFVIQGKKESAIAFFEEFRVTLLRQLKASGKSLNPNLLRINIREIESLDYLRNVIVYVNRNGFLTREDVTPFTYPWGANSFFYNRAAVQLHTLMSKKMSQRDLRAFFHSRKLDRAETGLLLFDGIISPICFCDIGFGEKLFRDARHYFFLCSRSVEAMRTIADYLGEKVFYTDNELFSSVKSICLKKFGLAPTELDKNAKLEMARMMRDSYNATQKQVVRMLRLEAGVVEELFSAHRR